MQRSPKAGNDAREDHPTSAHYATLDEIIRDDAIDLVVITTTPDSHFEITKQCLEHGKHVLCEKPFVPTSAEAHLLQELARENKRLLCVYQNRRWDADFLTLQKLIKDNTLGRIVEFHTHFDRHKPERPVNWKGELLMSQGGGVLYDLGTHLIDQVYTLFGMPYSVTAFWAFERGAEEREPDAFTAILRYGPNGPMVIAKASVISILPEQPRFVVKGTKGSFVSTGLDVQEDQLKRGVVPGSTEYGVGGTATISRVVEGKVVADVVPLSERGSYGDLYSQFARAVEEGDEEMVPVRISDVVAVLEILEGVKESAGGGKTVYMRS